ncbi:MAG TPA: hypothetical protein VFZ58_04180 [Candidatus Saccharimonadales bacterium]
MNHAASFEGSHQNRPPEPHQKNELYLETANAIRQTMGEADASDYLKHHEQYSFGPTGEAVNPLPEMRNTPVAHEYNRAAFGSAQNEQAVQPNQQSNVIDMGAYRKARRAAPQPIEYARFPQGPEITPSPASKPTRRMMGRIAALWRKTA